ncbi:MAG: PAS domain S-box protein [Proteobacteria bacterium]|nr:PAS domain S-box protein [Pseudomonadota bacterium]
MVAIIGVGNKKAPYREDDITQLSLYASSVWKIVKSKQAETAIQQRDQELQATFDQAAVGVAHVGLDGRWLRVNGKLCDIVGYAAEELMELTFQDITHPEDLDTDLGYVQKVLAGELQTYSMEKRYIRKDRSLVWINLTVSLVHDASGAPRYFISIIEDIDERKRGEEELRKLYAELEQRVAERTAALTEKAEDLSRSQQALQYLLEDVNEAKKELETKITEIERMNRVFVHRELRMVELKEKIRELEKKQDGSDPSDPEGKA